MIKKAPHFQYTNENYYENLLSSLYVHTYIHVDVIIIVNRVLLYFTIATQI